MKNNKGINLVALIIMIIVMIMLAAIAVNVSMDSYNKSLEAKSDAERQQVVNAIAGRFGDYQRNATANPLVGITIPEESLITEEATLNFIEQKLKNEYGKLNSEQAVNSAQIEDVKKLISDNFDDMEYTRILIYTNLVELGIENTNKNAVYIVNYYSNDVIGPIN